MGLLIDTNILSELRKKERCDPRVRDWFAGIAESDIYVSVSLLSPLVGSNT
jgi:predicted nucleic acid-binding protein